MLGVSVSERNKERQSKRDLERDPKSVPLLLKNCEGSEIISYIGKLVCHSFMDADGTHETLGSAIKDNLLLIAIIVSGISAFLCWLSKRLFPRATQ